MHKNRTPLALAVVVTAVVGLGVWLMLGGGIRQQHQSSGEQAVQTEEPPQAEQARTPPILSQNEVRPARSFVQPYPRETAEPANPAPAPPVPTADIGGRESLPQDHSRLPWDGAAPTIDWESSVEAASEHQARTKIIVQYTDLLNELALPADIEQTVREILQHHLTEQVRAEQKSLFGPAHSTDRAILEAETNAAMRQDLATVLSEAELAAYDEYRSYLPGKMLRMTYDMQLRSALRGLSVEEYDMISDVLVEEMFAIPSAQFNDSGSIINADALDGQLEALEISRQRLSAALNEQQMVQVDRFLNGLRSGIERTQSRLEPGE